MPMGFEPTPTRVKTWDTSNIRRHRSCMETSSEAGECMPRFRSILRDPTGNRTPITRLRI